MKHSTNHKLRIGVFDRWFFRSGGGEFMVANLVAALHKAGHEVELLTILADPREQMHEAFDVDMSTISVRLVPDIQPSDLSSLTKEYDVFINASHLDYIPNQSKNGMLLVFFPATFPTTVFEFIKRKFIVPTLQKVFVYPQRIIGMKQGNVLSNNAIISLSENKLHSFSLTLFFPNFAFSFLDQMEFHCGEQVLRPRIKTNVASNQVQFTFSNCSDLLDRGVSIHLPTHEFKNNCQLVSMQVPLLRFRLWQLFAALFPTQSERLLGGPSADTKAVIATYPHILSISTFTDSWISRYWNRTSTVIYPPVNVYQPNVGEDKKNWITHVGRFFTGSHSKHQLELVRAFKKIFDVGHQDWQLHLVGQVLPEPVHQHYLALAQKEAQGYPVFFHIGASKQEVNDILSESKLYWHATGLESNDPLSAEHFGISIVEAMSAGCVPLVYQQGAASEIVDQGSGYTFTSIEELVVHSRELINNPTKWELLQRSAITSAQRFSVRRFEQEIVDYVATITK